MDNEKKKWIAPSVETLDVSETQFTYKEGIILDGGTYENDCEYAGPTYS